MMTRDLKRDLEICEAATPGPWKNGKTADSIISEAPTMDAHALFYYGGRVVAESMYQNDKQFAIEAREGWPAAINRALAAEAEVERLREENGRLRKALRLAETMIHGKEPMTEQAQDIITLALGRLRKPATSGPPIPFKRSDNLG